jgi:hypothetical protein
MWSSGFIIPCSDIIIIAHYFIGDYFNIPTLYMIRGIAIILAIGFVSVGVVLVLAAGGGLSPDANAKVGAVFNAIFE